MLNDATKQTMADEYIAGQSLRAIGRKFGCDAKTVARHLEALGVARRTQKVFASATDRSEAIRLKSKRWRKANPEYAKAYRQKNKDRMVEYGRRYRSDPERRKANMVKDAVRRARLREAGLSSEYWRRRKYGVSQSQFDAMLDAQNRQCAICRRALSLVAGRSDTASVDHDHATGKVRGLLCIRCNAALGNFCDNSEVLAAAQRYLVESNRPWTDAASDAALVAPRQAGRTKRVNRKLAMR